MALASLNLEGLRALVTGGGSGLGRQMALGLAEAGAEVVVCGRREQPLRETVAQIVAAGGRASAIVCDVTDEQDLSALASAAGTVDVLVNNAGLASLGPWETVSPDEWRAVMALNLDAVFRLCQLFAPAMRERGFGRVVNVGSIYGSLAGDPSRYPGIEWDVPSYFASKHGVHGVTRYLAARLAPYGVCVNTLSPGMFPGTDQNQNMLSDELLDRLVDGTPMKRLGDADDLKAAVVFLASPGAKFVTGQDLIVDGGWSIW